MSLKHKSLSLRARLYLFSVAILTLFVVNVATHLWGSFARSESLVAYRDAAAAAQLIVLAVPYTAVEELMLSFGDLTDKIIIDEKQRKMLKALGYLNY